MNNALRASSLTLLLASLCACGGGNSTASPQPNVGNIPNLATRPTPQASQLKKVRLMGTVFNSFTGAPVEKAEVLIQVLSASGPAPVPTPPTSVNTPPPNNVVPTPPMATPPAATPVPGSNSGPDLMSPTPVPAVPTTLPPSINPPRTNFTPPPGSPPTIKPPDLGPNDGPIPPGAWHMLPGQGWFSARGAQAASFQLAQSEIPSGPPKDEEANLFRTDSNNKGKFFLNEVTDGRYLLTVTAPGYRTLSLTDVSAAGIEVPLTPIDGQKVIDVEGMVLSPSEKPVMDAMVSPSFPLSEAVGIPGTSDGVGRFVLPEVPYGVHSLVAFVMDEEQLIKQMGILKDISISDKTLKVKKPAAEPTKKPTTRPSADDASAEPTPKPSAKASAKPSAKPSAEPSVAASATPKPEKSAKPGKSPAPASSAAGQQLRQAPHVSEEHEETAEEKPFNLFDAVKEIVTGEKPGSEDAGPEIYPVIPLRSVVNQVVLAGTVDLAEGTVPKSLEVYLSLPPAKKGDMPQEAYLFKQTLSVPDAEASASPGASPAPAAAAASAGKKQPVRFRLNLPTLDKGQSYHLQLTAGKEGGEISYHHLYNLGKSDEELKVDFMAAPAKIRLEGEEVNAVPPVPNFSWDPVSGAELYHLSLEAGTGNSRRIVWEAWTKDTQMKFPLTTKAQRLQEQKTYTISVEAVKGLHPASNDLKKQYALPAYQAIWTDLARMTHTPFEVVE